MITWTLLFVIVTSITTNAANTSLLHNKLEFSSGSAITDTMIQDGAITLDEVPATIGPGSDMDKTYTEWLQSFLIFNKAGTMNITGGASLYVGDWIKPAHIPAIEARTNGVTGREGLPNNATDGSLIETHAWVEGKIKHSNSPLIGPGIYFYGLNANNVQINNEINVHANVSPTLEPINAETLGLQRLGGVVSINNNIITSFNHNTNSPRVVFYQGTLPPTTQWKDGLTISGGSIKFTELLGKIGEGKVVMKDASTAITPGDPPAFTKIVDWNDITNSSFSINIDNASIFVVASAVANVNDFQTVSMRAELYKNVDGNAVKMADSEPSAFGFEANGWNPEATLSVALLYPAPAKGTQCGIKLTCNGRKKGNATAASVTFSKIIISIFIFPTG